LPSESPDLAALKKRLAEEESAYAEVLAAIDALANAPLPRDAGKQGPEQMDRLNALWRVSDEPAGGWFQKGSAATARQEQWNAAVVQILNGQVGETARLHARLHELTAALVRYLQRVLPVMDARDRMATALATTRAELILEAFDRRLESLGRRLEGLLALRDRLETVSEQTRAISASLAAAAPPPPLLASPGQALAAAGSRHRRARASRRVRLKSLGPRRGSARCPDATAVRG